MVRPTFMAFGLALCALAGADGCTRFAAPTNPAMSGSIGTTSHGVLVGGSELASSGSLVGLRQNDRHFGLPRFVHAIERAAATVAKERAGSVLYVGDISAASGGPVNGHASHRSGRDADLLLYMTTLDGAPVPSPGFAKIDTDGLAFDAHSGRYLRFDVEREWLLVRSLIADPDARVQWIFVAEIVEAMLLEYARARGEDPDIVLRAQEVMLQPRRPALPHDDHIHVRTDCSDNEVVRGCVRVGPLRAWLKDDAPRTPEETTAELLQAIVEPMARGDSGGVGGVGVGVGASSAR